MPTYIVKHRGGNEDSLNAYTGIIYDRELIIERSNDGYTRFKVGDGTTLYADLPYLNIVGYASVVRRVNIELLAANWEGDASPYYQTVEIANITENSKIDLQPTPEQLSWMMDEEIYFTTKNTDGSVVVYAIGEKPTEDFAVDSNLGSLQATISETTTDE